MLGETMGAPYFVAALFLASAGAAAAQPSGNKLRVCDLLTPDELAVLGTSGQGREGQTPIAQGVAKGLPMRTCGWVVPPQGSVLISVVQKPSGGPPIDEAAAHEAEIAQMNEAFKPLKAQGWQEEIKDFGSIRCMVHTPPASLKDSVISTACFGIAKGNGMTLGANTKTRIGIETLKPLMDKAIARLP